MNYYSDSVDLQQAWALCRHEIYKVMVISHGQLTSWGKGEYGELGLGRYVKFSPVSGGNSEAASDGNDTGGNGCSPCLSGRP